MREKNITITFEFEDSKIKQYYKQQTKRIKLKKRQWSTLHTHFF